MNRFAILAAFLLLAAPAGAHNGVDDEPHHGGVVRPAKDLHLETVTLPAGGMQIYFSDAMGEPLPASALSDVVLEIEYAGGRTGGVDMGIDPSGVFWMGRAAPLADAKAVVRVGYTFHGKPGTIEVSGAALIAAAKKGPPKPHAH